MTDRPRSTGPAALLYLVVATAALAACHPSNTPNTEGSVNSTAAAVNAGSAPEGAASEPGVVVQRGRSASDAAADANTAATAIDAQAASGAASTASNAPH
jgi:hypothetical protein